MNIILAVLYFFFENKNCQNNFTANKCDSWGKVRFCCMAQYQKSRNSGCQHIVNYLQCLEPCGVLWTKSWCNTVDLWRKDWSTLWKWTLLFSLSVHRGYVYCLFIYSVKTRHILLQIYLRFISKLWLTLNRQKYDLCIMTLLTLKS